jgi:heat shock protein HspQ
MQQDQHEQQAQNRGESFLDVLAEEGDERLRKRVREHELGADDEDLRVSQSATARVAAEARPGGSLDT